MTTNNRRAARVARHNAKGYSMARIVSNKFGTAKVPRRQKTEKTRTMKKTADVSRYVEIANAADAAFRKSYRSEFRREVAVEYRIENPTGTLPEYVHVWRWVLATDDRFAIVLSQKPTYCPESYGYDCKANDTPRYRMVERWGDGEYRRAGERYTEGTKSLSSVVARVREAARAQDIRDNAEAAHGEICEGIAKRLYASLEANGGKLEQYDVDPLTRKTKRGVIGHINITTEAGIVIGYKVTEDRDGNGHHAHVTGIDCDDAVGEASSKGSNTAYDLVSYLSRYIPVDLDN